MSQQRESSPVVTSMSSGSSRRHSSHHALVMKKKKTMSSKNGFINACEAVSEARSKPEGFSDDSEKIRLISMADVAASRAPQMDETERFHVEHDMPKTVASKMGLKTTTKNMRQFVQETTRPVHALFKDYRDLGLEEIMEQRYRVSKLSYYVEVQSNLTDHLGRVPTVDEWACSLNMAVRDLKADIMKSQDIQSQLVSRHIGLIRSVAQTYRGKGVPMRDLIQEGSCGLIHAAQKFDPAQGYKFSTYARHWIRQHISRALARNSRMIRLPQRVHEKVVSMGRMKAEMSTVLGRDPTLTEIAERVQVAPKQARMYAAAAAPVRSVSKPSGAAEPSAEASATTMEDRIVDTYAATPEAEVEASMLKRQMEQQLLSVLPEIEREVILLRFGLKDGRPRTYEEVIELMEGTEIHSKKCVIKAETRAFYKLRKPSIITQLSELRSCVGDYEAIGSSTGAYEEH